MPTATTVPPSRVKHDRVVEAVRAADALERDVGAAQEQRPVHPVEAPGAGGETHALEHLAGRDDLVRAQLAREVALSRMLGDGDQPLRRREQRAPPRR